MSRKIINERIDNAKKGIPLIDVNKNGEGVEEKDKETIENWKEFLSNIPKDKWKKTIFSIVEKNFPGEGEIYKESLNKQLLDLVNEN